MVAGTESHRAILCFRQTLSCVSYPAVKLVLPHGNAPWSVGYQPTALLLSYGRAVLKMAESAGNAPASGFAPDLVFRTKAASLDRPGLRWLLHLDSHQDEAVNSRPCCFDIMEDRK